MNQEQKVAEIIRHDRLSRFHELVAVFLRDVNEELSDLKKFLIDQDKHAQTKLAQTAPGVAVLEAVAEYRLSPRTALDLIKILQIPTKEDSITIQSDVHTLGGPGHQARHFWVVQEVKAISESGKPSSG